MREQMTALAQTAAYQSFVEQCGRLAGLFWDMPQDVQRSFYQATHTPQGIFRALASADGLPFLRDAAIEHLTRHPGERVTKEDIALQCKLWQQILAAMARAYPE